MNRCSIDGSDMIIRSSKDLLCRCSRLSFEGRERKKETQLLLYRDEFNDNYSLDAHNGGRDTRN